MSSSSGVAESRVPAIPLSSLTPLFASATPRLRTIARWAIVRCAVPLPVAWACWLISVVEALPIGVAPPDCTCPPLALPLATMALDPVSATAIPRRRLTATCREVSRPVGHAVAAPAWVR